ncbi:DUF4232 domain-containing protein [Streptomyces fuscigenes]|uniref:DUF4232 domain-containing protein n=1 Tax=Streptomyces fuscigenes TaxID=1528880 RepID=UPI001F421187|nr:DUF4232 domain-containing protein [Streptomyces fuscigenes]MCF3960571.1 DUF4232 domain-containing protein [Streptomyces fuscigenes]
MRRSSILPLAVATLAGGLLLTACGGASGTNGASAAASATASTATGSAGGGTAAGSSKDADGAGATAASGAGTDSGSGSGQAAAAAGSSGRGSAASPARGTAARADAATGGGACRTADLAFAYGPGSGAQSVGSPGGVVVTMTNKGSAACSMDGYPGVDLVGGGVTWSLSRQTSQAPHAVTVRPGGSTSFTVTYMPYSKGDGEQVDVKTLVVTPPNETHSASLAWDYQPVLRQDGATHPATFVGPVGGH